MPILGILASSKLTAAAGDYESIATVTVGSGGAANVEFTSIGTDWTHLQLRYIVRSASDDIMVFSVNNDGGNNYAIHGLFGNGSSASAFATTSYSFGSIGITEGAASCFAAGVCDILDYRNTNKYKTFRSLNGREDNSAGRIELRSSLWMSTSAITSLKLTLDSNGNFQQYSHFALYGCKSA